MVIKTSTVPSDCRLVETKWVFKKKSDGRYRARVNAQGFHQIPGVDFTDSFAPVMHEVTVRIMLILWIACKFSACLLDVETAFFYGELPEEIYMKAPLRYVLNEDECLIIKKSIYGLVQSSRQWRLKLVAVLKILQFNIGAADPCLLWKKGR